MLFYNQWYQWDWVSFRTLKPVGYRIYVPSFTDYKAYEDAAEEFHPYIPFFATFDSKVRAIQYQSENVLMLKAISSIRSAVENEFSLLAR